MVDIFFPKKCIICEKTIIPKNFPSWICKNCYQSIEFIDIIECNRCGSPFADRCLCNLLDDKITQVRSLFIYDNVGKELIHKWKYSGFYFIKDIFKKFLIKKHFFKKYDGVIAVPVFWIKKILRGFNQAFEISKIISDNFKIKNYSSHISRKIYSKPQMKIGDYNLRKENVKGVFKILKPIYCENLLIVDDIITSCATVNEMSKTIIESGFKGNIEIFTLGLAL